MFFTWGRVAEPWGSAILGAAFHSDWMSRWTAQRSISTDHVYQRPFNARQMRWQLSGMYPENDLWWMMSKQFLIISSWLVSFCFCFYFFFSPLGALCLILIIEQTVRLKGCHWTVYKEREHLDYNNNHHLSPPYFQTLLGREDNIISPVQIKPYLYDANFKLNWLHWIIILTDHLLVVEVAVTFKGWKETIKAW